MMNNKNYDIAIIGAGASGLMACYALNNSGKKIVLLEKEERVGRKLLATGNGRCNMTNMSIASDNYRGSASLYLEKLLSKYSPQRLRDIFYHMGLNTRQDSSGRVYPYSEQASAVLDILRLYSHDIEKCSAKVDKIEKNKEIFKIHCNGDIITAKQVIIACGGKSQAVLGSDGSGYDLALMLGHSVTRLYPSLSPVSVKCDLLRSLKGVRCHCSVRLFDGQAMLKEEFGELQFTETSLSGICIFQLSPYINSLFSAKNTQKIYISVDLIPEMDITAVENMLFKRAKKLMDVNMETFLSGIFNKRISSALLKACKIPAQTPCKKISEKQLSGLSSLIKDWRFYPDGKTDFKKSQVTMGGIPAKEINLDTMESRLVENLFFAGEIIDIDGDCGGYNLHFAFMSGYIAGKSCLTRLSKEKKR